MKAIFLSKLFGVLAGAAVLSGCASSFVSLPEKGSLDGFHPTSAEKFEWGFVYSDMTPAIKDPSLADNRLEGFATEVCGPGNGLTDASPFVLKISSGGGGMGAGTGSGAMGGGNGFSSGNSSGGQSSGGGMSGGGGVSVALALQDQKTDTSNYSTVLDSKGVPTEDQSKAAPGSKTTNDTFDHSSPRISKCSLKVMARAVNVCVYKTLNRNALQRLENNGLWDILGVAGIAAAVGSLAHSNSSDLAWITGGATVLTTLASNSQKTIPTPVSAQVSSILNSGLTYLAFDPPVSYDEEGKPQDPGNREMLLSYGRLFDASVAACSAFSS